MAEVTVLLAVQKKSFVIAGDVLDLAKPFLANKSDLVVALPANMKLIKAELEIINAILKNIGMVECNDAVLEAWIIQIRRLAYDSEDIVDQFIYVVGEHKGKRLCDIFKRIGSKPRSLFSLDEIATNVGRVKNELMELSQRRVRWLIPVVGGNHMPVPDSASEQQVFITGHTDSVDEDEYIGSNRSREMLTDLLHSEDSGLCIIPVWGMGGVGKSTLVNYVYKKERLKFDCHAWISVSQSYKMDDILRHMLKELYGKKNKTPFDAEKLKSTELREELRKLLDHKRFLIILGDVWTYKALSEIMNTFIDEETQSRVIVTTRIDEVASVAEGVWKINLEPLNEHDAWTLFCRKAFRRTKDHICPPELEWYGKNIVEKCNGLPLALVAVGSLLYLRTQSEAEWKRVDRELIWELHNNPNLNHVENILNLSYRHLPYYLKNCFLYCAMFPEDHLLRKKN